MIILLSIITVLCALGAAGVCRWAWRGFGDGSLQEGTPLYWLSAILAGALILGTLVPWAFYLHGVIK